MSAKEFQRFSAPLLFYDGLNDRVLMGTHTGEGKTGAVVESFERKYQHPFFNILVDRERIFFPDTKSVTAFDSFTGEHVLRVDLEKNLKHFDYFPRGKIVYTHCNSHTLTGNSHTDPSGLLVERILVLEGEGDVRLGQSFSVYSVLEKKSSLLFKWDLGDLKTSEQTKGLFTFLEGNPEGARLKSVKIESAAFLTSKDVLVILNMKVRKGKEGKEKTKKIRSSFFVNVNIETGYFTTVIPQWDDFRGTLVRPNGDLFALSSGGVGAFVKHGENNNLVKVFLEDERSETGAKLNVERLYPNITFEYVNFRIFPSGKLFAFLVDGDLLTVNEQGAFIQEEEQVIDSAVLSPTKVLVIEQPPLEVESDEKEIKVYDITTGESRLFEAHEIGSEASGRMGEPLQEPNGILWIGDGLTCFYWDQEDQKGGRCQIFRIYGQDDPGDLKKTLENWEIPLFTFENARIDSVIPLQGSRTWRKFIHNSLRKMTPSLPDALSGVIAKFI